MRQIHNRIAWVISAVQRYHRKAAALHGEDLGQIAALACLMYSDDNDARKAARRMFENMVDERRPVFVSLGEFDVPDPGRREMPDLPIMARLWPLLDRLASHHREAVVRVFLDDVPRDYVAEELGLTNLQLGVILRTATGQLRKLCLTEGLTWPE